MKQSSRNLIIAYLSILIIVSASVYLFINPYMRIMMKDYTQLDELKGAGTALQKSNSISGRYSFFWPERELGIAYGGSEVAIINIADAVRPEVLSHQSIESDNYYANMLLGINNGHAFFNIAYNGIEIVDISNPSSPRTLGLVKEYGTNNHMSFAGGTAVTNNGIIDISDYNHPEVIEEVRAFAVLGHGNAAVFAIRDLHKRDKTDRIVSYLIDPKTRTATKKGELEGYGLDIFPMGAFGEHEFMFATRYGDDLMVLAINGSDGSIREIEDIDCFGFYPIAAGDQEKIYVSIGVPKYKETFLSMLSVKDSSKLESLWTIGIGTSRLVSMKAREGRVAFMTVPVDERGQPQMNPTVDIHVLDAKLEGLPRYVGGLKRDMFIPDFELVGDALYVMGKEGVEVYSFKD